MWRSFVLVFAALFLGCSTPPPTPPAPVDVATPRAAAEPDLTGEPEATSDVWRIGAVLSLSGAMAAFGRDTRDGIDLAVAQINARGGSAGRPLKVFYRDAQSQPDTMRDAVRASIEDDHVLAILGEIASSLSVAGGTVANELKTPMLSPGSTNMEVTRVGEFVFAAIPSDDHQGTSAAAYAVRDLKKRRVAILSSDVGYSSLVAGAFRASVPGHGGTIVADVTIGLDGDGLDAALAAIEPARPDVIFAPVYYDMVPTIGARAQRLGLPASLFLGTDGWDSEELVRENEGTLDGAQFLGHWLPDAPHPAAKAFAEAFRGRFGRAPSSLAAMGFEATQLLADAIERSKPPTRKSVRAALADTRRFEGLLGPEAMGPDRRPNRPFATAVIQGRDVRWTATLASSN